MSTDIDAFEREIRATLIEHADLIHDPVALTRGAPRGGSRTLWRRSAPLLASAAVLVIALVVVFVSWPTGSHHRGQPAGNAPRSNVPVSILPGTGTMCGEYAVEAVTSAGTIPLAGCSAEVGMNPPPTIHLSVGQLATIVGLRDQAVLTTSRDGVVTVSGRTILAVKAGSVVLGVKRGVCSVDDPSRSTCAVAILAVTG